MLGGPPHFPCGCGGHTGVLVMHGGNGGISDLGRRFVRCFVAALDDAGLPADPEFRTAVRADMKWAVAEVLAHEERAAVPAGLPMLRWGWNGSY